MCARQPDIYLFLINTFLSDKNQTLYKYIIYIYIKMSTLSRARSLLQFGAQKVKMYYEIIDRKQQVFCIFIQLPVLVHSLYLTVFA